MPITIVMIYSGGNPHARCFFPAFLGLAYFYKLLIIRINFEADAD